MPYSVLELLLMEKFNWTPVQVAEIPERKLREIMIVMDQREKAISQAEELKAVEEKMKSDLKKNKRKV